MGGTHGVKYLTSVVAALAASFLGASCSQGAITKAAAYEEVRGQLSLFATHKGRGEQ